MLRSGACWRGTLPLAEFERFAAAVNRCGDVAVAVRFAEDDRSRARVAGRCSARAEITCARCASEADVGIECELDFRLVATEAEAAALGPTLDTVVAEADAVSIAALVEDDLLLNLPEFGCVDCSTCAAYAEQQAALPDTPAALEKRPSPFAALATWRRARET